MKLRDILFIFLGYNVRVIRSDLRFVNYTVVPAASSSAGRLACSQAYADNEYVAARINDVTQTCEGLKWDWGSDPQYEMGYSYLRKIETTEIFQPSVKIAAPFQWLFPGTFGIGGSLEFYFSMPTDSSWSGFEIDILDSTEFYYDLSDTKNEVIMLHIFVMRQVNELTFKTWVGTWSNQHSMQIPFADGSTHKITVVAQTNEMQVLFDGEQSVQFTHPVNPATAKQISFWAVRWTNIITSKEDSSIFLRTPFDEKAGILTICIDARETNAYLWGMHCHWTRFLVVGRTIYYTTFRQSLRENYAYYFLLAPLPA